jgi:hypothetical protein
MPTRYDSRAMRHLIGVPLMRRGTHGVIRPSAQLEHDVERVYSQYRAPAFVQLKGYFESPGEQPRQFQDDWVGLLPERSTNLAVHRLASNVSAHSTTLASPNATVHRRSDG